MQWTIGKRTFGGFLLLVAAAICGGLFSYWQFNRVGHSLEQVTAQSAELSQGMERLTGLAVPLADLSARVERATGRAVLSARCFVATLQPGDREAAGKALQTAAEAVGRISALAGQKNRPDLAAAAQAAGKGVTEYGQLLSQLDELVMGLTDSRATALAENQKLLSEADAFQDIQDKAFKHALGTGLLGEIVGRVNKLNLASRIKEEALKVRALVSEFLQTRQLELLARLKQHFEMIFAKLGALERLSEESADKERLKGVRQAAGNCQAAIEWLGESQGKLAAGLERSTALEKDIVAAVGQVAALGAAESAQATTRAGELGRELDASLSGSLSSMAVGRQATLIGLAVLLVLGLALAWWLGRSLVTVTSQIARRLAATAGGVAQASRGVSDSSQELSQGATSQAASLEETSASLEELAGMTRTNAEHADQANHLMGDTQQAAGSASGSMDEMTKSMSEIHQASREIEKIIKTIDEIAFQTNLLALNAAVEAARAGEAGAGFAVVAEEVRNLAMRSAEAARDTQGLITNTVERIRVGSQVLERTSGEFAQVVEQASKVGEIIGEIAAASAEQNQGIDQISKAMQEMDRVTQRTAALSEESAASAEELRGQAEGMHGLVEDLLRLVGQAATRDASRSDKAVGGKAAKGRRPAVPAPPAGLLPKPPGRKPAAAKVCAQPRNPAAGPACKPSPEDLIPLDDTKDFEDF